MAEKLIQIRSLPGIKRDGTRFEGDNYVDGQWVRWQRGLPRKMGGYRSVNRYLPEIVRSIDEYTVNSLTYLHFGSASYIQRLYIDNSNNTSVLYNRTPVSGFTADPNNLWQFDVDTGNGTNNLVAQVAPNLTNIANNTGGALYYGNITATTPLVSITLPTGGSATGGVVALHPYTFFYGDAGYVGWSVPGDCTDLTGAGSGAVNVTGQKIVKGMPLRGGAGNSPAGLFWSLDSLIRATFVGGDLIFQFDTISAQTSILSAASVIEYDGLFYWVGVDRFLVYNGVVREVVNTMNINYFFDGLNFAQRQKVFAFKVPRYGEIWWCYPRDNATECTHAVIYNVRENTWYDTELPNSGRAAGQSPVVYRYPMMTGVELDLTTAKYKLWVHEIGTDEIDGQNIQPINSYFETADLSLPTLTQENKAIQTLMLEPDFVQSGDMTVQVIGRANARSSEVYGPVMTFPDIDNIEQPQQQVVYFKEQRRELRFKFGSNVIGGDYQMGIVLAHIQPADGTVIG
jgi:hypothetical protein